jgi:hypothetical protein
MASLRDSVPPLWLGDAAFQARLTEYILEPIQKADRFEEEAMPVRPLITVYGHHEADKAEVVKHFCKTHSIGAYVIQCRFGFTGDVIHQVNQLFLEEADNFSVLILDHADVLLLEPNDSESQLFALGLRDRILKERILLVGCFDRVLNARETDSYGRNCIRPWMHAICYLAPPSSTWIAAWLQTQLEGYVTRHGAREGFTLHLTEGEYTVVAQYCVGASYGHLVAWVRRIWYHAYQSGQRAITKEWLQTPPLMTVRSGRVHILEDDVRNDESKFSIAAGLGPVGAPAQAPSGPPSGGHLMQPMPEDMPKAVDFQSFMDEHELLMKQGPAQGAAAEAPAEDQITCNSGAAVE